MAPPTRSHVDAYRATHFKVLDPDGAFVMWIDDPCPELRRCHERHGVRSSLFITAWNPQSACHDEAWNREAQKRLLDVIRAGRFHWFDGFGEDPKGIWAGEPSFLVLGIDEATAIRWGREFGQCAVVFSGDDAVPELLVLQDIPDAP